jgi:hypothetical protein
MNVSAGVVFVTVVSGRVSVDALVAKDSQFRREREKSGFSHHCMAVATVSSRQL